MSRVCLGLGAGCLSRLTVPADTRPAPGRGSAPRSTTPRRRSSPRAQLDGVDGGVCCRDSPLWAHVMGGIRVAYTHVGGNGTWLLRVRVSRRSNVVYLLGASVAAEEVHGHQTERFGGTLNGNGLYRYRLWIGASERQVLPCGLMGMKRYTCGS
jgi:hypothetical protein